MYTFTKLLLPAKLVKFESFSLSTPTCIDKNVVFGNSLKHRQVQLLQQVQLLVLALTKLVESLSSVSMVVAIGYLPWSIP